MRKTSNKDDIKTTTITENELLRHKNKIKKRAAERFLSGAAVYSFDRDAAKEAALLLKSLHAMQAPRRAFATSIMSC